MGRNAAGLTLLLALAATSHAGPLALEASRRPTLAPRMVAGGDGTILVAVPGGALRLDPATRAVVRTYTLPAPDDDVWVSAVAPVGNDVLLGLFYSDRSTPENRFGLAYLLDGTTGAVRHVLASPLPAPQPSGNGFGESVAALDGDLLVGAPFDRAVYRFDGATGVLEQTYPDPGPGTAPWGQPFGSTVLALGDAVVVGAPADYAVHVFDTATGALRRSLADPRATDSGRYSFGAALAALDGGVLVGAPVGDAAVFLYDPATGALVRTFANPGDPLEYSDFGRALAVGDGRVVVGDPGFGIGRVDGDYDPDPSIGIAYVFDAATAMLLETLPNPTPIDRFRYYEDERFGAAMAAVPGRVVVSDPRDYTDSFVPQGGAYVYVDVTACGNGTVDPLEGCDDGNGTDGDGCDANCRPTACGNGVTTPPEGCDDGNTTDADFCDSNCQPTGCGNGVAAEPEQCDDGNTADGDGCSDACTREVCGNGLLDPTEECDDGNTTDGDACSATCRREPRDYFTCYRARRAGRPPRGTVVLTDAVGSQTVRLGRPVAWCQGDGLTAPTASLTCYRVAAAGGARATPRPVVVHDAAGQTALVVGRTRTLCVPSAGSRVFKLARTFVDPTPPADPTFGASVAGVDGRVVVGSPQERGNVPGYSFDGAVFAFDAATGALERTIVIGGRALGVDVADGGGGQVLIASVDLGYLDDIGSGVRRRTFDGPGSRTPVQYRPITAVGPYVVAGDPYNHSATGLSWGGAAHVFDRASGRLLRTLVSPTPGIFRYFGSAVAGLDAQHALVSEAGQTYLFDLATGALIRTLPGGRAEERAVAGLGRHALVGLTSWFGYGAGTATLFDVDTGDVVTTLHDDLAGDRDGFGTAVASAAGAFVVGAPNVSRLLTQAGAVHVFDAATGERRHTILSPDLDGTGFGRRVAPLGNDLIVARSERYSAQPGRVYLFHGGPLDAFQCHLAKRAAGGGRFVAQAPWIADRFAAGPVRLERPATICNPVGRDGGPIGDAETRLACYAAVGAPEGPRQVTVENAFGTETLTILGRRAVCLPGRTTTPP